MKVIIPSWQGRVSPVLDVAGRFLLVTVEQGQETTRDEVSLGATELLARARQISTLGAEAVICGAISRPLELALRSAGVQVVADVCGQVDDVLSAFADGRLNEDAYLMPGCRGRRRHGCLGRQWRGQCRTPRRKGGNRDAQR
jgi:predicted Fe-Mo cluster-binding NifX family protein